MILDLWDTEQCRLVMDADVSKDGGAVFFGIKSLIKQQSVTTHTIRQTEILGWVTNTRSVKMLYLQKCLLLHFREQLTCLSVGRLRICPVSCLL
jgi:hypothetical protein